MLICKIIILIHTQKKKFKTAKLTLQLDYACVCKKCQHCHSLGHSGNASKIAPAFTGMDQDEGDFYKVKLDGRSDVYLGGGGGAIAL